MAVSDRRNRTPLGLGPQETAAVGLCQAVPKPCSRLSVAGQDPTAGLPPDEDIQRALLRGWVHCWLADRRPIARSVDGAAVVFVAVDATV